MTQCPSLSVSEFQDPTYRAVSQTHDHLTKLLFVVHIVLRVPPDTLRYLISSQVSREVIAVLVDVWQIICEVIRLRFFWTDFSPEWVSLGIRFSVISMMQEDHRYPFAGCPNALVKVGVVSVLGGDVTWMDLGSDVEYIARVKWFPSGALVVLVCRAVLCCCCSALGCILRCCTPTCPAVRSACNACIQRFVLFCALLNTHQLSCVWGCGG